MPDYRGKRATYRMSEIVLAGVTMFLFKEGSRNQLNEDREEDQFRRNYKTMFGLRLPHLDTVSDVMNKLDTDLLESCRRDVIKYLLDKRTLHKFRLLGKYFTIAIDGSGVYAFDKQPYAGCPLKQVRKAKRLGIRMYWKPKLCVQMAFVYQ
jgi:hypothetical protein